MKTQAIYFSLLLMLIVGCKKHGLTTEESYKWLDDPENNLVSVREANGLQIKVKLLPSVYTAHVERSNSSSPKEELNKIVQEHDKRLTFLMTIGPKELQTNHQESDIMFNSVSSYQEYIQRTVDMNFELEKYVKLVIGNKVYKPVLSSMENTYGLENRRNILFVFVPDVTNDSDFYSQKEIDFVYSDELFEIGINHFVFDRSTLKNLPELNFK